MDTKNQISSCVKCVSSVFRVKSLLVYGFFVTVFVIYSNTAQVTGMDKSTSLQPIFWVPNFPRAPSWARKKRACKSKARVRSRNNRKHCVLFFITKTGLLMYFHQRFLQ